MNKRGFAFRQIVLIFYLILAIIVVFTLVQRSRYVVNEEQYVDAYSKNIAMTANSLLYSDYDTTVSFVILDMFKVEILDDVVRVSTDQYEKEYNYIPDSNFKIEVSRDGSKLFLRKVKIWI